MRFYETLGCAILLSGLAAAAQADENLKTPYVMLDPTSMPQPSPVALPVERLLRSPSITPKFPESPSLPTVRSTRQSTGSSERITIGNSASELTIEISADGRATVESLRSNLTGYEFLVSPSPGFHLAGGKDISSDVYRVDTWRGTQHTDSAELTIELRLTDTSSTAPERVVWRSRIHRNSAEIEQYFAFEAAGVVLGQVLNTKSELKPVMPANLFGRGFTDGRPNIPDRHRFEFTSESEHICYDDMAGAGLSVFVSDIGGQERIAEGKLALIQNPSFQTTRSNSTGRFVIQPFHGPVEIGFVGLRDYVQREYSIQKYIPSVFEWNQFWLWMGGPVFVDYSVVTQKRLFDVLPLITALGLEEFHLDAGWQRGPGDWTLDPQRFPGGWDTIRNFNREHGLAFHLWVNDPQSNSASFLLDLVRKSGLNRLFIDRCVTETTLAAIEEARKAHPSLSVNVHNSTSRSAYWPWGNLHFLNHLNQIYFGEGEFWAWSNIKPEANVTPQVDPDYPQRTEAERFFSKHNMATGDLITRAAAYQAHWIWPFNCVMPPHSSWDWFEKRPISELKHRAVTYLACKFKYEWGFDPRRLTPETIEFHKDCTAWFKTNRDYLALYQHVLDPPDGKAVDAVGHLRDQKGYIFLFNPAAVPQHVEWKQILWEPELRLSEETVTLSDWTNLSSYTELPPQLLNAPEGQLTVPAGSYTILGINLRCEQVLKSIQSERAKLGPLAK